MPGIRPSPSAHAAELEPGTVRRGNDRGRWIVKDVGRVRRWVRIPAPPGRAYLTHDNGGSPIKVFVDGGDVTAVGLDLAFKEDVHLKILFKRRGCVAVHVGQYRGPHYPPTGRTGLGNSILVQTGARSYVFIGDRIFAFTTPEPVLAYRSPIGNSDVPYPWAEGEEYVYLMVENVVLPRRLIGRGQDPYACYYGLPDAEAARLARQKRLPGHRIIADRLLG
ncbi:MAG: hypothetical protein J0M02_09145 [Planctomycetes bacterium]|nr:hypothetical protein [Planctomycetota bacterium]